jgi:hypothetical protein
MSSPSRQELEEIWRQRVRQARLRYEDASAAFRSTWGEHFETRLSADPMHAIQQARKVESQALTEYVRVLKIFTELVLRGKAPRDQV